MWNTVFFPHSFSFFGNCLSFGPQSCLPYCYWSSMRHVQASCEDSAAGADGCVWICRGAIIGCWSNATCFWHARGKKCHTAAHFRGEHGLENVLYPYISSYVSQRWKYERYFSAKPSCLKFCRYWDSSRWSMRVDKHRLRLLRDIIWSFCRSISVALCFSCCTSGRFPCRLYAPSGPSSKFWWPNREDILW